MEKLTISQAMIKLSDLEKSYNQKMYLLQQVDNNTIMYILELDDNYQYAVIGSSSDKYLWILSRTPQMDVTLYKKILRSVEQRGYDLTRLVFVKQ